MAQRGRHPSPVIARCCFATGAGWRWHAPSHGAWCLPLTALFPLPAPHWQVASELGIPLLVEEFGEPDDGVSGGGSTTLETAHCGP